MKADDTRSQDERKSRIEERLDPSRQEVREQPMLAGANSRYGVSGRITALACGGIALVHELVRSLGLAEAIDRHVHVLKRHFPYHESDHVLNLAYNVLAGGTCLEDLEKLRHDEAYLDALGAQRIPDPTTAGDFLRRFEEKDLFSLMAAQHQAQVRVWRQLPRVQRDLARIDVDGTIAATSGECKEGMDVSFKGQWGYAPLLVSLANTSEVIYAVNRPGNSVSHAEAAPYMGAAAKLARSGGFRRVRLRGDTDFSLTRYFDEWSEQDVEFVFGMDAHPSFVAQAEGLPESAFRPLERAPKREVRTEPRRRPENVKERIVRERGFTNLVLESEHVAELAYTPARANGVYRLIVLRKTIRVEKGQLQLGDQVRYFFYVTNVDSECLSAADVVFEANARCDQENVIEQLKNGVGAMRMPSDSLLSNWAYLMIASLAWNLKAWLATCLPHRSAARELRRMEFRRFLNSLMLVPCQLVRSGRRVLLRILTWTPWAHVLIDGTEHFRRCRLA